MYILDDEKNSGTTTKEQEDESTQNQQQDWSILWSCFENPLSLLSTTNGLPKGMQVKF